MNKWEHDMKKSNNILSWTIAYIGINYEDKGSTMKKWDHDMKKSNNILSWIIAYIVISPLSNITQLRRIASLKSFPDIKVDTRYKFIISNNSYLFLFCLQHQTTV